MKIRGSKPVRRRGPIPGQAKSDEEQSIAGRDGLARARQEARKLRGITELNQPQPQHPHDRERDVAMSKIIYARRLQGIPPRRIADDLGIEMPAYYRLWSKAFEDFSKDYDRQIAEMFAESIARRDVLLRAWFLDATGGAFVDKDGETHVVVKNRHAATIYRQILRDGDLLIANARPQRIEHSGVDGGPIVTIHVDAQEAARLVREQFATPASRQLVAETDAAHGSNGDARRTG